ncbi:MAG: hypothetical protein O7A69_06465 [SAR324 cluster bacterium]|nr:hypothetical protein [SAR324 cluster bacterium]
MATATYPEYHRALLNEASYPSASRRIKFEETRNSYIYRTGEFAYVVRKAGPTSSSIALREVYARETLALGRRWAPEIYLDVVPIVKSAGGYALHGEGEVVDYALRLIQLSDHYWLHKQIPQGKFNSAMVGRLARYLAQCHQESPQEEIAPGAGRPENFRDLAEEVLYQVKKYVNITVSPPVLDAVTRPIFKFVEDHRKLFLRRQKKGRVLECHGAFVPEHVYIKGKDVFAVSPLSGSKKFRVLDAANDLATFLNELARHEATEQTELFVKRYVSASRDREITTMLPPYRTLQAMRSGLIFSESQASEEISDEVRSELAHTAQSYFDLAVQCAREIPK